MLFYSTSSPTQRAALRDAVLRGLAEDRGLYMPVHIPKLPAAVLDQLHAMPIHEIGLAVAKLFFGGDVDRAALRTIVEEAIDFDAPLVPVHERVYSLELFHGPTLAFKDFGARFMAHLMSYLVKDSDEPLFVLVATSGDTGSAVAHGFLGAPHIEVVLLYPSGKVSHVQEMQLTTLGRNITALEVAGSFDDCQHLVKNAFVDADLRQALRLSSANSINIARLIPQTFYYLRAVGQLGPAAPAPLFAVPSGNFGNLTAGLLAKRMGMPAAGFVAATNVNDVVPLYLESGTFNPRPSLQTISNAMDVGDPSNFIRMMDLYGHSAESLRADVVGARFTDDETKAAMRAVAAAHGYLMDPHGAVGYRGLMSHLRSRPADQPGIFLETAHPAKFGDVVQEAVGSPPPMPERLQRFLEGEKKSIPISGRFSDFKDYLLSRRH